MSNKWRFWVGMSDGEHWKNYSLFKDWVKDWNRKVYSSQSAKRYDKVREKARDWYKNNLHLKPGEAAPIILAELDLYPKPEVRTIKKWIKDLAPPDVAGKGRPKKK